MKTRNYLETCATFTRGVTFNVTYSRVPAGLSGPYAFSHAKTVFEKRANIRFKLY